MKPVTDRGNSRVYLFIQSFILPIFLSIIVSAFIIVTALRRSLDIGRLSIPPVYDDVVYLYFSQSILHAASHQSLAATVWQIIDQHSPLTILFGVIGYSVVNAGDVGPYIVGAGHLAFFVFACVLLLRRLPPLAIAGIVCAIGSIPLLRISVTEFRPEAAWSTLTALAAIAFFATDLFASSRKAQVGLGLLAGLAVISKPTTGPYTLIVLGTAFLASGLAQYYEKWIESSPPPLRRVVACAATIWIAALCIIVPIGAVIGPDIYNYLVWVLRDIKPQVEYRAGFSDQLLYYSYGIGGRLMMGKAVTICLAMWGVGIGYAALRNRAALPRIIGLMLVILVSYAIPSFTSAKFVWFGAAFDSLLIIATVYLIALLYEPFASQGGHGKIGAMISAAVGVAGIALLLNSNLSPQVSGLLGMDAAARSDMADRTERIWQVLRTHEKVRLGSNPTGHVSNVMTFAVEPIAGTVISFYSAKEGLPMRNVDFSYATSVDELLSKLPDVDYVVAGPSFEHPLSGAKLGDAFREAMDKRSDFSRIATIPLQTAKGMAIIYERNLP